LKPSARIFVADDHPLYLEAMVTGLTRQLPDAEVTTADNYLDLFDVLNSSADDLDLLVMDLLMPGSSGNSGLYFLRRHFPELPIIVVSAHDDLAERNQCLALGAAAFISKSAAPATLFEVVEQILEGCYEYSEPKAVSPEPESYQRLASLTPSQFKVLHLIAAGHTNKEIAERLNISEKTVKTHITAIFSKLGVSNRTQAALLLSDESN